VRNTSPLLRSEPVPVRARVFGRCLVGELSGRTVFDSR
jgi:hypothetical protein